MTIKIIEEQVQETPTRYTEEVYVDAVTDEGTEVSVIDSRRTRIVTVAQLESERDSAQSIADSKQSSLDEITALEAE